MTALAAEMPQATNSRPTSVHSARMPVVRRKSGHVNRSRTTAGARRYQVSAAASGMTYRSSSGACTPSRSMRLRPPRQRFSLGLRPSTILVAPLMRAYSAICTAGSSPYTVMMRPPSSSARRRFSRRLLVAGAPGLSTYNAVNPLPNACPMRAAARMTRPLEGAPDRQHRMFSLVCMTVPQHSGASTRSSADTMPPTKPVRQSVSCTGALSRRMSSKSRRMSASAAQPYSTAPHSKCRYRLR